MSDARTSETPSDRLVSFCDALRDAGISVTTDEVTGAARALLAVDALDRDQVYYGLKATLVSDPDEVPRFDELFEQWWEGPAGAGPAPDDEAVEVDRSGESGLAARSAASDGDEGTADGPPAETDDSAADAVADPTEGASRGPGVQRVHSGERARRAATTDGVASRVGVGADADRPGLGEEGPASDDEIRLLVREVGRHLGTLPGRETRRGATGRVDLRAALNQARPRSPDSLPRVRQRTTETKLRLFVDVSRSMLRNLDSDFLLRFVFECVRQYADPRVYFFDTAVADVTARFEQADLTEAVAAMDRARTEWGAGTTIGRCLQQIRREEPFVVDRDTVAMVVSDGWDAGDLDLLADELAAIERRARLVVWLNPLATSPSYRPTVGGMATALPHVDLFYGFETVADLEALASDLAGHALR